MIIGGIVLLVVVVVVVVNSSKSTNAPGSSTSAPGSSTSAPASLFTSPPVFVVSIEKYQDDSNLNLGEVKIYNESGVIIPSSNLTSVLSPLYNSVNSFPSSNLFDNSLTTFTSTNKSISGNQSRAPFIPFISSLLDRGQIIRQFIQVKIEPPSRVSKIEIYNRSDCCQARINDVIVKTIDSSNNLLSSVQLKGSNLIHTLTYNSINGSNSNYTSTGPNPSDYEMYGPDINNGTPMTAQHAEYDPYANQYVFMVIDGGLLKMVSLNNEQSRDTVASATDTASSLYRTDQWNNYNNPSTAWYNGETEDLISYYVRRKV